MMYHLLTGPCQALASSRVSAIKDGRSVSAYFESLVGGTEDKESVKEKIDLEIKSALDAGMNFNVSLYFECVFLCIFASMTKSFVLTQLPGTVQHLVVRCGRLASRIE